MTSGSLRSRLRITAVVALALAADMAAGVTAPRASAQEDPPTSPESVVLFIVDLSGSMNEPFGDGRSKLDVAKAGFSIYMQGVDLPVGLRVYGDQLPAKPPAARQENCETDTRLIQPVKAGNNEALVSTVDGFTAQGDTPIALALQEAARNDIPEGALATIVLFSDGRDECHDADLDGDPNVGPSWGPHPCDVAEDIADRGIDLRIDKINTIGFQAAESEEDLRCISGATGGEHRNVETEEDLSGALNELGNPRTAVRLGGDPIEGTPTAEGAPTLERIAPGESNRRITDSVKLNEERWYFAPEYGPGEGHTTLTVFDLPRNDAITIELRFDPGPEEWNPLVTEAQVNPGLASDFVRCGGCHFPDAEPRRTYFVVHVHTEDQSIIEQSQGETYDIELLLQEVAWGGASTGCVEGNKCWYESQIEAAEDRKAELEEQLSGPEELGPIQDEIAELNGELASLESRREGLEAGPDESTNWLLPLLLGLLAALGAAGWVALARRKPAIAPATAATASDAQATAVIGTIDLGGAESAAQGSPPAPTPEVGTGAPALRGEAAAGTAFGEFASPGPEEWPGSEAREDATEAPLVGLGQTPPGREVPESTVPPEPGREVPEAGVLSVEPGREVPEAEVSAFEPGREVPETDSGEPGSTGGVADRAVSAPTELPTETTAAIPAGWFDDPDDPSHMRWWDGSAWTEHTHRKE